MQSALGEVPLTGGRADEVVLVAGVGGGGEDFKLERTII